MQLFSVDPANRTLPLVRKIVEDVVTQHRRWRETVLELDLLASNARGDDRQDRAGQGERTAQALAKEIDGYQREFEALSIQLMERRLGLVDFAIAFLVLLLLMAWYRVAPSPAILAVPVLTLIVTAAALGAGLWLSALNVTYRDVRHAVPFLIQVWFFATPVAYATSSVPPAWRMVYALANPMVGVIDSFRWAILGAGGPPPAALGVSVLAIAAMLVSGLFYFRRMERRFADVV